jgi:hypothetical protein
MIVSVGDVTAKCRSCGGVDFEPVVAAKLRLGSVLACSRCKSPATYRELLDQIGEEAMRRANEAMQQLRKKPPPPRSDE